MMVVTLLVISLNKWEMLINGSGWVHFMAFTCFIFHYLLYDRIREDYDAKKEFLLNLIPFIIILFIAGPYSAIYSVSMILAYAFDELITYKRKRDFKRLFIRILCIIIPLLLYIISRYFSVEEHAGATSDSIFYTFGNNPLLFIRLFIYSFASMIIGGENILSLGISDTYILLLGIIVILIYAYALYINLYEKIYQKTVFPLILLVSGGLNHLLISVSRWIFLDEYYSMSSRYALQFHIGIIGIVLTFALSDFKRFRIKKYMTVFVLSLFVIGNLYTTSKELDIAKYRKEYFVKMHEAALGFENYTDKELSDIFLYHDGARVRNALDILKEKKLNVFK